MVTRSGGTTIRSMLCPRSETSGCMVIRKCSCYALPVAVCSKLAGKVLPFHCQADIFRQQLPPVIFSFPVRGKGLPALNAVADKQIFPVAGRDMGIDFFLY